MLFIPLEFFKVVYRQAASYSTVSAWLCLSFSSGPSPGMHWDLVRFEPCFRFRVLSHLHRCVKHLRNGIQRIPRIRPFWHHKNFFCHGGNVNTPDLSRKVDLSNNLMYSRCYKLHFRSARFSERSSSRATGLIYSWWHHFKVINNISQTRPWLTELAGTPTKKRLTKFARCGPRVEVAGRGKTRETSKTHTNEKPIT